MRRHDIDYTACRQVFRRRPTMLRGESLPGPVAISLSSIYVSQASNVRYFTIFIFAA
jgi:hypothetical protein